MQPGSAVQLTEAALLPLPQPASITPIDPGALLRVAVERGAGLEQLEKFMALKERWDANEARKAFNAAFAAFKAEAVKIIKGTDYTDGPLKGRSYANLFDIVDAVTPHLSKHGLSISWRLSKDEPAWMESTCTLRHVDGHSESAAMGGAPDTGPGRNAIQARGSAKTYLEKYTATSILGLAAADQDDDGGGGKTGETRVNMTDTHQAELRKTCEAVGPTILGNVLREYKATALADIPDSEFQTIATVLSKMKKAREGAK